MKVGFVGTGTMGSISRGNQSVVVDNILFDVGSGVVKKMESLKWYTKGIDFLVITHVHADHFFDIPNLLIGRSIRNETVRKLTIIGGIGIRDRVIELMTFSFGDGDKDKYREIEIKYNIEFVELDDGDCFDNEEFRLTAYELEHGGCKPILGFVLEKDGEKIGYATDTSVCDNVTKICESADYLFLDATNTVPTRMHMGLDEVVWFAERYPEKTVFAIHRSDYVHEHIGSVRFPNDGDVVII